MSSNPVTAPPLKATCRAGSNPLEAACAVRTFARTAITMPTYPAMAEAAAPTTNPIAVNNPKFSDHAPASHRIRNITPATMPTVRYWRFK